MICCCLCLKDSENTTLIFEDNGGQYNIAAIVAKHFWFEPLKDDPLFTAICKFCCAKLVDFHAFYEMVEVAHQRNHLPESVTVKTESTVVISQSSKQEPNDEMDEVPFSTEVVATNKPDSKSLVHGETHPDLDDNNDDDWYDNACDMDEFHTFEDESEHSDPFDNTGVITNESTVQEHLLDSLATVKPEKRLTRNSRKSETLVKSEDDEPTETKPIKKRRKRNAEDKSDSKSQEPKPKKQRGKDKINKNQEEESAYKSKMKSFDNEISQYMGLHCDVCNVAVENFASLKIHMRNEHNIDNGFVRCCDKKFHKRANLLYHIRHHVNPNCYRCEECDQTFSDYQSLRNHLNVKHQKEEDKIYECTECPKKFARKYLLEQHRTFKHKDRCKQCKMCNRRYKTLEELEEHNKEPCAAGIMCDICAKVIFGPGAFKRHQLEHEGGQAHKVQCDMCGSWHRDKYALRKHKRRHLEPKTPHVCDICQKVSPSREAMVSHKKYAHRSDRTFECEFCQKCFKRPISLREHMTTHTGAVLYTCPHCPKTFNSNANMHSHRKNVHPVEFEEARKRRQRVGYLGDQTSVAQNSKSKLITDKKDADVSDLSKIKTNEPLMVYNTN